jgi:hypothetical protein
MKNFRVGRHEVQVWVLSGRWFAAVDGLQLTGWHPERTGAWAAGVRKAAGLDGATTEAARQAA